MNTCTFTGSRAEQNRKAAELIERLGDAFVKIEIRENEITVYWRGE